MVGDTTHSTHEVPTHTHMYIRIHVCMFTLRILEILSDISCKTGNGRTYVIIIVSTK